MPQLTMEEQQTQPLPIPRPSSVTLVSRPTSSLSTSFTSSVVPIGNGANCLSRPSFSRESSTPPSFTQVGGGHIQISSSPSMSSPRDPSPASSDSSASTACIDPTLPLQLSPTHAERPHEHMGFFRPPRGVGTRATPLEPLSRIRSQYGQTASGAVPAALIQTTSATRSVVSPPRDRMDMPRSNSICLGVQPFPIPIAIQRARSSSVVVLPPLAPTSHPMTPGPDREPPSFLDLDAVPSIELSPQMNHASSYSYSVQRPSQHHGRPSILSTFDLSAPLSQSQPGPDRNRATSPFPVDDPRIGLGTLHTQELTSIRPLSPELDAEDLALAADLIDVRSPRTDLADACVPPTVTSDDGISATLDIRSPRPTPNAARAANVRGMSLLAAQVLAASQTRAPLAMHGQYGHHSIHGPVAAQAPSDLSLGQGLGLPVPSISPILTPFGSNIPQLSSHSPTHANSVGRPQACLSPTGLLSSASFDSLSFGSGTSNRRPPLSPRLDKSRSSPGPYSSDGTPRKDNRSPAPTHQQEKHSHATSPALHLSTPSPSRPAAPGARSSASTRLVNSMDALPHADHPISSVASAPRSPRGELAVPFPLPKPPRSPSSALSMTRAQFAMDFVALPQRATIQSSSGGSSPSHATSPIAHSNAASPSSGLSGATSPVHRSSTRKSNIIPTTPQVFSSC